ncbi:hypothetical protein BD309DRAFT_955602 [Dichomitus squalens]|uniref:Uncharacterized protein n=1 Tax=Dichomitus squalens TaxID=114155 RepID=A0A4Q9NVF0_9APHY|nr:hypothetical protein BD309DRAFT_955602 [Dichomitus squalens]TBU62756.1 hypothetical protein BD310DRAFT_918125 [Dichomitus squalens]
MGRSGGFRLFRCLVYLNNACLLLSRSSSSHPTVRPRLRLAVLRPAVLRAHRHYLPGLSGRIVVAATPSIPFSLFIAITSLPASYRRRPTHSLYSTSADLALSPSSFCLLCCPVIWLTSRDRQTLLSSLIESLFANILPRIEPHAECSLVPGRYWNPVFIVKNTTGFPTLMLHRRC